MRTEYTLGFVFDATKTKVLLMRKSKPDWQADCLNGIGGKVDYTIDKNPLRGMIREFKEETGIEIYDFMWTYKGKYWGDEFIIHVYSSTLPCALDRLQFKQNEDEPLGIYKVRELCNEKLVCGIDWIIPICLNKNLTMNVEEKYGKISIEQYLCSSNP